MLLKMYLRAGASSWVGSFPLTSPAAHRTNKHHTPRVIRFGFGAIVIVLATLFALTLFEEGDAVGAQAGPSPAGCGGDYANSFGSVGFNTVVGNKLLSSSPTSATYGLGSPIPAGTYQLSAVSYDGYTGRESSAGQGNEQWFAELLDGSGNVLATTGTTGDLADGVAEATWSGGVGQVTISATATQIRTVHAAIGSASGNSVRPVCIGAQVVAPPETVPPSTTPPDTTPPDTTPPPAPGPSTITVQKITEGDEDFEATLTLDCGASGSARGTDRNPSISVGDLQPGSTCLITVEAGDATNIAFNVEPASVIPIDEPGNAISITVPADGLEIVVSITCILEGGGEVDPEPPAPEPEPEPELPAPEPEPPAPEPKPEPQPVKQPADQEPAKPVAGTPDFTG